MIKKKIAIFCGGPSSEHDVSLNSAYTIYKRIDKKKYELYFFYISKKGLCKLLLAENKIQFEKIITSTPLIQGLEDLKRKKIFAFLAGIHGEFVEDGRLQMLLEYFLIPYSGSDSSSSALCMDKFRSMLVVTTLGIDCPQTILATLNRNITLPQSFSFPVILKPNTLGSSVGVYKINTNEELKDEALKMKKNLGIENAIIQEYIHGIEMSCGVLQKNSNDFISLPPIEIRPKKGELFDYSAKYEKNGSQEITPPISISKELSKDISDKAIQIHKILGCKTYSRSDFIVLNSKFYYLETNTLPGMTSTSLLPQEADSIGISFPKLIDFIIEKS